MILSSKEELTDFLNGKSVALVGPSPHLQGESMGSKIDAHDVVARVNEIDSANNAMEYGSRTDMVFFNFAHNEENTFSSIVAHSEIHPSLVWLVCPRHTSEISLTYFENRHPKSASLKIVFLDGIDFPHSPRQPAPTFPTTGFLSMLFLMQSPLRKLFVSGFSFYSGFQSYNTEVMRSSKMANRPYFHVAAHPVMEEVRWLQAWELPKWVTYDAKFQAIIIERKYIGRNPFVLGIQIFRNSIKGLKVRLGLSKN